MGGRVKRDFNYLGGELRGKWQQPKWFWPAASAGSPSISPAFDSHWNITTGADRVVARIGKPYGTSLETRSIAVSTAVFGVWQLVRQYVTPLPKSVWMPRHTVGDIATGSVSYFGTSGAFPVRFQTAPGGRLAHFIALNRIVDSAGTTSISPARTITGVTIPAYPSGTFTSSAAFLASDVGHYFYILAKDNLWDNTAGDPLGNSILSFTNSSSIVVQSAAASLSSTMPGSGRVMVIRTDQDKAAATSTGGAQSTGTNYVLNSYDLSLLSLAPRIFPPYFLVTEIGFMYEGGGAQTVQAQFGDPSATLDYESAGVTNATGGYVLFTTSDPLMVQG